MGLKDQLIQKMNSDQKENKKVKEDNTDDLFEMEETEIKEESKETDDLDLDNFFDEDEDESIVMTDEEIKNDSKRDNVDQIESDFDFDEVEDFSEPVKEKKSKKNKVEVIPDPEPEPEIEPEPVFVEPEPEPQPQVTRQTYSYTGFNNTDNSNLEAKLLIKAKQTVLDDISSNFKSNILTEEALKKIIDAYINKKKTDFTNSDAIFTSVLDEIISSDYSHDYYGELVQEILESVKSDIN